MSTLLRRAGRPLTWLLGTVRGRPLSTAALIEFTRSIRFFLTSGMTLRDAMRALADRGSRPVRGVARNISKELAAGWSLQAALEKQDGKFPTLFLSLATVGEETGNLPEVMKDLEKYYELQQQQARQLRSQAFLPVLQFVAAVGIIAMMIYILGKLPPVRVAGQAQTYDALGLGLVGTDGALTFVALVFGALAAVGILFWVLRVALRRRAVVEQVLLALPLIGPCLRAIALTRFSFAMRLMSDSSLSILRVIRLAFTATDNPAFIARAGDAEGVLKRGNAIVDALAATRMFPRAYLSSVAIGEESGHLPEVMAQHAEEYDQEARRRITVLNRLLATLVWLTVAGFVIFLIFRVFTQMYLGSLDKYAP